jgi:hypothetical protein
VHALREPKVVEKRHFACRLSLAPFVRQLTKPHGPYHNKSAQQSTLGARLVLYYGRGGNGAPKPTKMDTVSFWSQSVFPPV